MCHDQRPNQPRRNAPARPPDVLLLPLRVLERHVERLPEALTQEMRRSALQGPPVLHERFDSERLLGAGEALRGALGPLDHRHGEELLAHVSVLVQHVLGVLHGALRRGVGSVSLLPEEFRGAEEGTCAHLPPHDIGPLVYFERQIAMAHDPLLEHVPNHRLARRPHDQRVFQLRLRVRDQPPTLRIGRQPVVRHYRALLGESVDVLCLLAQEALGNQ
mmetsp:Transcript_45614/g.96965  ORF Transcript_45614/g.96965 Transcript_45614/m.96965 type:complete len:218 (-) Transcript_45614:202-855(-)